MKKDIAILVLIVLAASLLSTALLTRGHLWWDDFASYIMQSQSILTGTEQDFVARNTITIEDSSFPVGPVAYPWGFPLILAPFYAFFGLNILALKLVNVLFFGLFLIVFYALLRNRLPRAFAAVLTGFLAFNPALLAAHDLLLSDIPFLFFSTLTVFLLDHAETRPRQVLLGLAMFAAVFIRTNGILLASALLAADTLGGWPAPRRIWKNIRKNSPVYLTFAVAYLATKLVFPGGEGSYFAHYELFNLPRLWSNIIYYLTLPRELFEHFPAQGWLFGISAALFVLGVVKSIRSESPTLIYMAATLVLFISWPERQGLRFIFPLLPFYVYFAFVGGQTLVERAKTSAHKLAQTIHLSAWGVLALTGLIISLTLGGLLTNSRPEINGPFDPYSTEMFSYIREKTPADSLVVFFKPRAMRLFTDRNAIMLTECERITEADYVIINEKMDENDQVSPEKITTCNPSAQVEKVFKNKRFSVYKIKAVQP